MDLYNTLNIIIELASIIVMSATTVFCYKLNKKIALIRSSRKDFEDFIASFDNVIIEANKNIENMKQVSAETSAILGEKIIIGDKLLNELSVINDIAEGTALKLESMITEARITKSLNVANDIEHYKAHNKLAPSNISVTKPKHDHKPTSIFAKASAELMNTIRMLNGKN